MRVFVTGATGFVGSHLIRKLASSKHDLCCLVRETSVTAQLEELGTSLVRGDVTRKGTLARGMAGCDCVIHLANVYSLWESDTSVYSRVNIDGTRNVTEAALDLGVPKVIHVSTVLVYGKPDQSPFSEETPPGPVQFSEYARTKAEGDRIAWQLHETRGLPLVVLYPCGILGPGDEKVTGQVIRNLVSGKMPATVLDKSVFTYVHVRDVAEGIVKAMEREGNTGEKYFLGNLQLSMREFYEIVCECSGARLPRFKMPDPLAMPTARLLTLVANIVKRPPLWGMSTDAIRMTLAGHRVDGTKAERELGITYTPLRQALEECVQSLGVP
jgi:dihydroflavonol-4-reductase